MTVHANLVARIAQQGWAAQPDFIPPSVAEALRHDGLNAWHSGAFRAAGTGRAGGHAVRPNIRSDQVLWLDDCPPSPALDYYRQALEQLRLACNREMLLGLFELEAHFSVYSAGSFYQRHLDRFHDDGRRTLSTVLYLNKDWHADDGGQLRLYLDDRSSQDIGPRSGTLVVFFSARFEHEVLPARRQRLSIAGWLRRRV